MGIFCEIPTPAVLIPLLSSKYLRYVSMSVGWPKGGYLENRKGYLVSKRGVLGEKDGVFFVKYPILLSQYTYSHLNTTK